MRPTLIISIALLLCVTPRSHAKEIKMTCISLDQQIAIITGSRETNALLLDGAFEDNGCPAQQLWSIENAHVTLIENMTIFYGDNENIDLIKSLAEKNTNLLVRHIPDRIENSKMSSQLNMADAHLHMFNGMIRDLCGLPIELKTSVINERLWLISSKSVPLREVCSSVGVVYAGYYIELEYDNGVITEVRPDKSLESVADKPGAF